MARKPRHTRREPRPSELGWVMVHVHPLFDPLASWVRVRTTPNDRFGWDNARVPRLGPGGWAAADAWGRIWHDPDRAGTTDEWAWVFAYLLLQFGLGHLPVRRPARVWVIAADVVAEAFLETLKLGRRPSHLPPLPSVPGRRVAPLFERWQIEGIPSGFLDRGVGGAGVPDLVEGSPDPDEPKHLLDAERALADGLSRGVRSALEHAAGQLPAFGARRPRSSAEIARNWLISAYPLLGALAAGMELEEDPEVCRALEISIAAVDPAQQIVYVNPHAGLTDEEMRFVLAHELLHAGLRHDLRRQGRDPFLWNVACDYVINGWLREMQLGHMPERGVLYDPELKGSSAEEVYDRIANDLRRLRKLATLRGTGACDVIESPPGWWRGQGCDLDAFYRRALATGLELHHSTGRGDVPAGLVEAIRVLAHPPIPWDVALAQWFDRWFSPLERFRTYGRPSRRQASTPDIPRPRYVLREDALDGRTFGVVLDTSGSMPPELLGRALGAIASYAASRDVPAVRVVFCDATPYDAGYLPVESIAGKVKVRGRGGTVLQPGIQVLEAAPDFPRTGPILIITDTECDPLRCRRDHAFLVPMGKRLPFTPRGPVFRIG